VRLYLDESFVIDIYQDKQSNKRSCTQPWWISRNTHKNHG